MTSAPSRDLPTVVCPIETMTREFDSKLVVAVALAEAGCRVVLGHKEVAQGVAAESRGIVWQGKSVTYSAAGGPILAEILRRNGSGLMFLTDEGAVFPIDVWEREVLLYHQVDALRAVPGIWHCAWGQRQQAVIARHAPELADRVVLTGNPRFDLCLPSFEWIDAKAEDDERERSQPYILVNTRFGYVVHSNGYSGHVAMFKDETFGSIDEWFPMWRKDAHDFVEFVIMVRELSASFPQYTIVIRPHPSESLEFYQTAFKSCPNVKVDRSHGVLHWIRKARLVVHNNCTTGIEAILAGRPVLHFLPYGATTQDMAVAREAGETVETIQAALEAAQRILTGDQPAHRWSDEATGVLHNLVTPSIPLLVDATLRVIREQDLSSPSVVLPKGGGARARRWFGGRGRNQAQSYVESKRGQISEARTAHIVAGCQAAGIGRARISDMSLRHVVVEPA